MCDKIDKTTDKYKVTLKFVNKILLNLGKEEINDLTKFQNIDREDIIKEVNMQTLKEMENDILDVYDKRACGFYNKTKSFVLNCLRHMVKELGFTFKPVKKDKCEYREGKSCKRTHYFYSIQ